MLSVPLPRFDELQSVIFHLINLGPINWVKALCWNCTSVCFKSKKGEQQRTSISRRRPFTSWKPAVQQRTCKLDICSKWIVLPYPAKIYSVDCNWPHCSHILTKQLLWCPGSTHGDAKSPREWQTKLSGEMSTRMRRCNVVNEEPTFNRKIAKGTTDEKVNFRLPKFKQGQIQILSKFHPQNLDQASTSKSQWNISITIKLEIQNIYQT